MKCFYIVFALFITAFAQAQIINIETKRFLNDTNGWVGHTDFNFSSLQNTQQVISFGNSLRVQYKHNKHRLLLLNDINFIKAGNTDFANSGYQHLRYSYKLLPRITSESFIQTQYNPVLKLKFRYLIGTGPRVRVLKKESFRVYSAILYMFEHDEVNDSISIVEQHRLNIYATCSWNITSLAELNFTLFYQPSITNPSDYRLATDSQIEVHISKHIAFKSGLNILYDTNQPKGIPDLVYLFKNSLSLKF